MHALCMRMLRISSRQNKQPRRLMDEEPALFIGPSVFCDLLGWFFIEMHSARTEGRNDDDKAGDISIFVANRGAPLAPTGNPGANPAVRPLGGTLPEAFAGVGKLVTGFHGALHQIPVRPLADHLSFEPRYWWFAYLKECLY